MSAESMPGPEVVAPPQPGDSLVTAALKPRAASRTEQRNPRTADIDIVPTEEMLRLLNAEDATVAGSVAEALPILAKVVDHVVECVRSGGQVHYFGAGPRAAWPCSTPRR